MGILFSIIIHWSLLSSTVWMWSSLHPLCMQVEIFKCDEKWSAVSRADQKERKKVVISLTQVSRASPPPQILSWSLIIHSSHDVYVISNLSHACRCLFFIFVIISKIWQKKFKLEKNICPKCSRNFRKNPKILLQK
jgi:hypothetical protein